MHDGAKSSVTMNRIPTLDEEKQKQAYANAGVCNEEQMGTESLQGAMGCGVRERTLAENIAFRADREQKNADRSRKALRILRDHPEFEDFIWLLRSGQI